MTTKQKEQKKTSKIQKIDKITKRQDYLRASKSKYFRSNSFIIQFYNRADSLGPRYGVTATKKIGTETFAIFAKTKKQIARTNLILKLLFPFGHRYGNRLRRGLKVFIYREILLPIGSCCVIQPGPPPPIAW